MVTLRPPDGLGGGLLIFFIFVTLPPTQSLAHDRAQEISVQ